MSNKRIALITGANKGIGLETARQLGKEGITVLVGARDEKKSKGAAEELRKEGIDAHGVVIEVDSSDSIKKAAASVEHEQGRLDILINNAGRIVNMGSLFVSVTYRETAGLPIYGFHVPAYTVSKAAVNAFTVQLAYEL